MALVTCPECASDDLEVDQGAPGEPGIAVHCLACGHRFVRSPQISCRRCGSTEVDEVAVDGWAFDDLEAAREDPQTTEWSYVDKVRYHCRKCHNEWQSVDSVRPYEPPDNRRADG